ncbi:MAG: xanthine dehydrogenase molybdopterin binding subunit [Hyphomicrobiales bacterium]|nr:xanthine dehydrogenase molybdopterin binding subunit [Hyphomicrobiales bacterium]
MNKVNLQTIGKPIAHDSARMHVSGTAAYIDDIVEPVGTLHLAPGLSDIAKGRLISIDLDAVRAAPGVVAVLSAEDIPGRNDCSPGFGGDPIFAEEEIKFHGQVIFAVVAETRDQARRASRLAKIEIDSQKPNVHVEDGLKSGETVLDDYTFIRGDAPAEIDKAMHTVAGKMTVGGQEHFYLEGQISFAIPGENKTIKVLCSTQHPTEVQHLVARALAQPDASIVCECRRMGGGFGGKESQAAQWACIAALAARVTGHPAKMRLDRDDDMVTTGKRHDFLIEYSASHDEKGIVEAIDLELNGRCGHSADVSLGINDRAMFHCDNTYYYPNLRVHSRRVKTDTVSNTAFRGFGGPQGMVFAERLMDQLAIKLDKDPLTIRKRNYYSKGRDVTPYGQKIRDNVIRQLVGELEKSSDYKNRRKQIAKFNKKNRFLKKGISLNPVKFGIAFTLKHLNQAGSLVHVYTDGSVQVNHGGTEMGQGLNLKVAQVVAEEFGIDISRVQITATSTEKVPNTTPTAASSGSDLNGMATKKAAEKIKGRMIDLAVRLYQADKKLIRFVNGEVDLGNQTIKFSELANRCFMERVQLSATGFYATPKLTWDRDSVSGKAFLYFAYGASCSEVTIDTLTGEMKVDRVDILHDVGSSINPAIDIGQIEGGFVQGMGWLTTEELVYDEDGRLRTHAPSTYKIPTCSDVPDDFRTALFVSKGNRENTIYRSKAVGEPPLMLAMSVFSAIFHAIASINPGQIPELDTPATPEAILRAVDGMNSTDK